MDIRHNIITIAEEMFLRWGFKRVTMDDIAREMSMSKKTIYQFFKDKNEMVCAVTEQYLLKEEKQLQQLEQEADNVIECLIKITGMIHRHVARINPCALKDLQKHYPEGWQIFLDYKTRVFHQSLVRSLQQGIAEGYFREDIQPEIIAILRMEQVLLCFEERVFPRNRFDMTEV